MRVAEYDLDAHDAVMAKLVLIGQVQDHGAAQQGEDQGQGLRRATTAKSKKDTNTEEREEVKEKDDMDFECQFSYVAFADGRCMCFLLTTRNKFLSDKSKAPALFHVIQSAAPALHD